MENVPQTVARVDLTDAEMAEAIAELEPLDLLSRLGRVIGWCGAEMEHLAAGGDRRTTRHAVALYRAHQYLTEKRYAELSGGVS